MTSPRPSLDSSTSIVSSSGSDVSEEGHFPAPQAPVVPTSTTNQTTVTVGKIEVKEGARVPGVLNGTLVNSHLNIIINRLDGDDDKGPVDLNGFVTDAVKINADKVKSYLTTEYNTSSSKLTGTKEDVEGLSRRWCYLISSLVTLSLITLLGTAVLSLTSWRTSNGSTPTLTPATHATVAGLSAEEKHFAAVEGSPPIVGRTEWVAQPSKWSVNNTQPIRRVVVSDSSTDSCGTPAECTETVRTMQMVDVEQHHQPDIRDNFLIGGDGQVYWGRGFASRGNYSNCNDGEVGVAFVGAFVADSPGDVMVSTFHQLVGAAVRAGIVAGDYALLARSQVVPGASVGSALLQAVQSWPHYNSTVSCVAR